jgi:DNA-directed RNA polymerase specialized sigma24 family protein
MLVGSNCDCLLCRLEKHLVRKLGEERAPITIAITENSTGILEPFRTPLDLVRALHALDPPTARPSSDLLLRALVEENALAHAGSLWQQLLLLVFIPTIHRTTTQVACAFSSLARDDVSQHVLSVFLEFLGSRELRERSSHFAFTIARNLRRRTFRWAIHESRLATSDGSGTIAREEVVGEPGHAAILLDRFLDQCEGAGWLSAEERHLLVLAKIHGLSCRELATGNGHSPIAIQHRLQRVVERLRRAARSNPPRQLELFPSRAEGGGSGGKIF